MAAKILKILNYFITVVMQHGTELCPDVAAIKRFVMWEVVFCATCTAHVSYCHHAGVRRLSVRP